MRNQDLEASQPIEQFIPPMPPTGMPIQPSMDASAYEKIIDNNELIDELMHTLKAEIVDNVLNKIVQRGTPLVSDEAINWIIGRLLPYTSKIFSLSILDERNVKQIIYEFETEVSLDLMFPENFGIERKNRDYIKWLMVHCFHASIYKAKQGETLKKLLMQHQITETTIKNEQQKQSFLKKAGIKF
jgi:hypothetical protein